MINLQIAHQYQGNLDPEVITTTAQTTLDRLSEEPGLEMTVVIEDEQTIQNLNRDYLGIDAPTDVLSFYAHESDPDTGNIYLGDVIISLPQAQAQAMKAGHPLQSEVALLVVHGTLHLLGYDHSTLEEKQQMWAAQQQLLEELGIEIKQIPEA